MNEIRDKKDSNEEAFPDKRSQEKKKKIKMRKHFQIKDHRKTRFK